METQLITIKNNTGLEATFSTLGAGVRSLKLHDKRLILEPKDINTYLSTTMYFGKTVGRVIGRISTNRTIDGKKYPLLSSNGEFCLHGGETQGFAFKIFDATQDEDEENVYCHFSYFSPDGESGFPGNLTLHVTYMIPKNSNAIEIRFKATTDQDTFVSISNHMYWNLLESDSINDYRIQVKAGSIGGFNKGSLLISKEIEIPSFLDMRKEKSLKDVLDDIDTNIPEIGTMDHAFRFTTLQEKDPQIVLKGNGLTIECRTDFPASNIFVDSTLNNIPFNNKEGLETKKRRGIAFEPQTFILDDDIILRKENTWSHFIRYDIKEN